MDSIFPILGIVLIGVALIQMGMWTGTTLLRASLDRKKYLAEIQLLRQQIYERSTASSSEPPSLANAGQPLDESSIATANEAPVQAGRWQGYRKFRVTRLVKETWNCTSVYLQPLDLKTLPVYLPGQHITVKLQLPGSDRPCIRCYTLSDAPGGDEFRITVKLVGPSSPSSQSPSGVFSTFVNRQLQPGELIDVKAPSGSFFLQPGTQPVVLLAGGVGITPMISMINEIIAKQPDRKVILAYGVRNASEHIFRQHLTKICQEHENIHMVSCYSQPGDNDRANVDYQVSGFVSVDVLKQILPTPNFDFYLCGPPAFMDSLYSGLMEWGVADEQIRFEAFGPASIKTVKHSTADQADHQAELPPGNAPTATFAKSGVTMTWGNQHDNLLELAEANGVMIDAGCRAGSCGTCQTKLLSGQVQYEDPDLVDCPPGWCLPCIARPANSLELDA